jgi:hypothetical protein
MLIVHLLIVHMLIVHLLIAIVQDRRGRHSDITITSTCRLAVVYIGRVRHADPTAQHSDSSPAWGWDISGDGTDAQGQICCTHYSFFNLIFFICAVVVL